MTKRYKLINNYAQKFAFITLENGGVIYTEDDAIWAENGYKSLNETSKPLEGNFSESYSENESEIIVSYTLIETVEGIL